MHWRDDRPSPEWQLLVQMNANLPAPLTSFVGRRAELEESGRLLAAGRLLTVVGPPGVGKTRLALRLAELRAEAHSAGTLLVQLDSRRDRGAPTLILTTLLGIVDQPEEMLLEILVARLSGSPSLLLLDNCEHLIDACASLAHHLLERCPPLRILATSRQPLGVPGETVWTLPGMEVSVWEAGTGAAAIMESDAVRLFCERVAARRGRYDVGPDLAITVARICSRLDGLPLAIELAAGRVGVLSAGEILKRLDDQFA